MTKPAAMPAGEVLAIVDALGNRQVAAWIGGGWAVDALVGEQTRPHRDPDLTAEQLVRFHLGYQPQPHDRHDMGLLRHRLGIAVPKPY